MEIDTPPVPHTDPNQAQFPAAIVAPPPRPRRSEDAVAEAAAKELFPAVNDWLRECGEAIPDDDEAEIAKTLRSLASSIQTNHDGFDIAQDLERHEHWSPDAALVEILDGASHLVSSAHRKACIEWTRAYRPLAPVVGTLCRWPRKPEAGVGTVTFLADEGTATVSFPALGHGVQRGGRLTHGSNIPFEDLADEPDQPARIPFVASEHPKDPPWIPAKKAAPAPERLVLSGAMKSIPIGAEGTVDFIPADFSPREAEMLTTLRLIRHATKREPGVPDDESGYHENAFELASDQISKLTGEPRGW